ncbi:hypothetical protein MCOR25_000917 [Pyricularia grisea]|uniref:Pyridoxamine 5'-phosphate oxidase Alr4036 family FMN-binding domain-containing protein n=1 Tax=Pyricularia grisea TaxID=148305 RepID=A0A6P8BJN9_PYRGI|nr:uncharacterized protein PgNI_01788 [Pyricularia grisea]KAI6382038.1 hypothetical protein MCOR25_000917 [Pyricularia grisea]TLD16792.1 hypothetical protein PgNI_01788 [Pyricularia grisea]
MASSTTATSKATAAPWRADFTSHVAKMPQASFVLSTLDAEGGGPRARTCIFRGMWGALPANDRNPAERNPEGIYESDMPVFTTDARMQKTGQIEADRRAEAVWWVEETQTQWRMRGVVWQLGRRVGDEARAALERRMRDPTGQQQQQQQQGWSWEREVTGHFGNLSPMMRGTFKNPPPGTPRAVEPGEGSGLGLGQKVEDLEDDVARGNFLVCVIVPDEVDRVILTKDPQRFLYRYVGDEQKNRDGGSEKVDGDWETVELWP